LVSVKKRRVFSIKKEYISHMITEQNGVYSPPVH